MSTHPQWRRWLPAVATVSLFALMLFLAHRELAGLHLRDILAQVRATPASTVLTALLLALCGYAVLTQYDALALRYAGKPLALRDSALIAFVAYAFGHNLSLPAFTAAAVRYRLYSRLGLSVLDVGKVTVFCSLTSTLAMASLCGISLITEPQLVERATHVPAAAAVASGIGLLLLVACYLAWASASKRTLEWREFRWQPPGFAVALTQLVLGMCDFALAALVLWWLLPSDAQIGFVAFVGVYVVAVIAGMVSSVPGGLGVFESVVVLALPTVPPAALLAAMVLYRFAYYLFPLLLAAVFFAILEARTLRSTVRGLERARDYLAPLAPQVIGSLVFVAGALLIASGATPALAARIALLRTYLPLPFLEVSHLLGSVAGLGMLLLARGLFFRQRAAYHTTFWLLVAAIPASLAKGLDYEEAGIATLVLALLWLGRRAFDRTSPFIISRAFSLQWTAYVAVVLGATTWIGLFAHRHVEYSHDLWWSFAFAGDASRVMRATTLLVVLAVAHSIVALMRSMPADEARSELGGAELLRVSGSLAQEPQTLGHMALCGGKRLMFDDLSDAFLMYQISGRSWIALGDPVGDATRAAELVWRFREACDQHGGVPVFYQVSAQRLSLYLDIGLVPFKIGEEARVHLQSFSLEGRARAKLRQSLRHGEREGLTFAVLPKEQLDAHFDTLSAISSQWLQTKHTAEKQFSVGAFTHAYLAHCPIAVVLQHGAIIAFANILLGGQKHEASVDMMRFGNNTPNGAMDFLFISLLQWARDEGYAWFNLGMAPLSGLGGHKLSPRWQKLGNLVFEYGEYFYNFEGLRDYKDKFDPVWQSRYLVSPGGLQLTRALFDVSALISGGVFKLVRK